MNLINKTELIKVVEKMPRHSEYNKDDILEIINSVDKVDYTQILSNVVKLLFAKFGPTKECELCSKENSEDCKFCELNDKDKFEFDMKKFEKFFKKVFTFEE